MTLKKVGDDLDRVPAELNDDMPSRTKRKKAAEAMQKTGEQLLSLTDAQLDQLEIAPELRQAVVATRAMTRHGARRRQLQYIGALMRREDGHLLQQQLMAVSQQKSSEARHFKQVEMWRDELKAGNEQRLNWLIDRFPGIDRDELARLMRDSRQGNTNAARKSGRALFRFLRQLVDTE